ncbi:hypothetical protein FA13DRAFT_1809218 [Coprinellus micaceus]|uniref:Uncharacterized protein n=1 Tax=Coprinellus micaceus TaxID=71717 RepID=A0A4Y7TW91_COPMI|nr:hypothetical protein FA13DRAFT_1809218 [Coprinellus micaceus]
MYLAWNEHSNNCPGSLITVGFPPIIPDGLIVPNWAYLNVEASIYFDATWAKSIATYTGDIPSTSATATATPTRCDTTRTCAIIGGAVGAIVGAVGLATFAACFWLIKWRNSRELADRSPHMSTPTNQTEEIDPTHQPQNPPAAVKFARRLPSFERYGPPSISIRSLNQVSVRFTGQSKQAKSTRVAPQAQKVAFAGAHSSRPTGVPEIY